MDCNPPGSSVHGILQARILEWVAIPSSRGYSQPRDQTPVSCIAGRFFITEIPGKRLEWSKQEYMMQGFKVKMDLWSKGHKLVITLMLFFEYDF